ncbi:MAG: hypothetical protein GTO60_11915, partial [Gammaproteobacteria bacterium]|nr:hypothetical protein [Gammaproteobacteria bacterium]
MKLKNDWKIYAVTAYFAAIMLIASPLPIDAKVTGVCSTCHTMHNSQNSSAMATY